MALCFSLEVQLLYEVVVIWVPAVCSCQFFHYNAIVRILTDKKRGRLISARYPSFVHPLTVTQRSSQFSIKRSCEQEELSCIVHKDTVKLLCYNQHSNVRMKI